MGLFSRIFQVSTSLYPINFLGLQDTMWDSPPLWYLFGQWEGCLVMTISSSNILHIYRVPVTRNNPWTDLYNWFEFRVFLIDWLSYQGCRAQFVKLFYQQQNKEGKNSYISQEYQCKVTHKQPHPGFELQIYICIYICIYIVCVCVCVCVNKKYWDRSLFFNSKYNMF